MAACESRRGVQCERHFDALGFVALELLCSQLVEFDIAIPLKIKEQLAVFAKDMGIEVSELQELRSFTGVSRDGSY